MQPFLTGKMFWIKISTLFVSIQPNILLTRPRVRPCYLKTPLKTQGFSDKLDRIVNIHWILYFSASGAERNCWELLPACALKSINDSQCISSVPYLESISWKCLNCSKESVDILEKCTQLTSCWEFDQKIDVMVMFICSHLAYHTDRLAGNQRKHILTTPLT